MNNVFILGGAGKIARRLAPQRVARGHQPRSLYRHSSQAQELEAQGDTPVGEAIQRLARD
ncbi:hypothetical protein M1B34_25315 [Pseudomonas sp. MAFF 302030]|uniref:Uncharacterized protein n=1 Tax=Pseudomonas morbosilactucae TaxID=2938197 RepID=A0A9X1Z0B8_9PSED|nr:hypothetical protein [Pseudomonas morbosilactucae]MCK9800906.1 hypothetical protein [Pseudomonas morbosilactucae]